MLTTIIITSIILGMLVVLLGLKIFFVREGKFPDTHVDGNKALMEKGITCAKSQDRADRQRKDLYELIEKEKY